MDEKHIKVPISVIICTYNRAECLSETLNAIFSQEYKGFEVIVVNGPSNDNTEEILKKYPVRIIKQISKGGLAEARNMGIEAADSDIIAFIDDDALADKYWLTVLMDDFNRDPSICAIGGKIIDYKTNQVQFVNGTITINGRYKTKNENPQLYYNKKLKIYNIFRGTNMAFRRSSVYNIGCFDPYYKFFTEDTDLAVRLIQSDYKVIHQPNAIVVHKSIDGLNKISKWDFSWYTWSRNNTYFLFKNFSNSRNWNLIKVSAIYSCYYKIILLFIIYTRKEIDFTLLIKKIKETINGVIDGYINSKSIFKK